MANKLYPKIKEALLQGNANLSSGTVKAVLLDTGAYTQADTHEFLSSVPSAARIGTPQTLGTKTFTNGVFDAADSQFTGVPTGSSTAAQLEAILIYLDTGTESTSRLVAILDTGTGLPVTPNGGNINVTWDAAGIFAL